MTKIFDPLKISDIATERLSPDWPARDSQRTVWPAGRHNRRLENRYADGRGVESYKSGKGEKPADGRKLDQNTSRGSVVQRLNSFGSFLFEKNSLFVFSIQT